MAIENQSLENFIAEELKKLREIRGVVGYSNVWQIKVTSGRPTGELCIRVYVKQKRPAWFCKLMRCMIPRTILGVSTDVQVLGDVRIPLPTWLQAENPHTGRQDVIMGGESICHKDLSAGTLAVVLRDKTSKQPTILSNLHVIWNIDNPGSGCAQKGDNILQPGPYDGGLNPQDAIATADKAIPLDFTGQENIVDAGTALWNGSRKIALSTVIQNDGSRVKLTGYKLAVPNMTAKGCSRNGDLTVVVTDIDAQTAVSGYGCHKEGKVAWFSHVVIYSPSLGGGSSGTTIFDPTDGKAIALNFAGSGDFNQPGTFGIGGRMHVIMESSILNLEWPPPEEPPPPRRYGPASTEAHYEVVKSELPIPEITANVSPMKPQEGQEITINGRLFDLDTLNGLANRELSIDDIVPLLVRTVETDENGEYSIKYLAQDLGPHIVTVRFKGDP